VVLFDILAVALNCAVLPMVGALPVTVTAVTVLAAVLESLHADAAAATAATSIALNTQRRSIHSPYGR
jgi:hypothetical protein